MPALPRRPLALAALAAMLPAVPAAAQSGGSAPGASPAPPSKPSNAGACRPSRSPRLRCPDLIMRAPYGRYFQRVGGRLRYHAGNSIVNRGQGPAEIFGERSGPGAMGVTQHIYGIDGRRYGFPSPGARVVFKAIPGQGGYWKFENAARFELWTVDLQGRLIKLVRTGPKLVYCLRDLTKRIFTLPFSPPGRHFPACNQDPARRSVTLGTSVGWADEYPSSYYEQWIDVTGLRGRFIFIQRADPENAIRESNEANNVSPRVFLRLPPPGGSPSSGEAGERY